jgi:hypothetical protein
VQRTLTLYYYDELSPEAQEKAREWFISGMWDSFMIEDLTDVMQQVAADLGYEDATIEEFDVDYRMVKMTSADVDEKKVLGRLGYADLPLEIDVEYRNNRAYVDVYDLDADESVDELADEISEAVDEDVYSVEQEMASAIAAEWEWQTSDEKVEEAIETNEYTFLEDGTRHD